MPRKKEIPPFDGPEFIVARKDFDQYFTEPLKRSTFFDRVEEGKILPWPHLKGRYYLNASLQRLGLPTVTKIPEGAGKRSLEDLVRLAFTIIDPNLFPAPPWLLAVERIDVVAADHARRLADNYREKVWAQSTVVEKLHYFAGVLDGAVMQETAER